MIDSQSRQRMQSISKSINCVIGRYSALGFQYEQGFEMNANWMTVAKSHATARAIASYSHAIFAAPRSALLTTNPACAAIESLPDDRVGLRLNHSRASLQ